MWTKLKRHPSGSLDVDSFPKMVRSDILFEKNNSKIDVKNMIFVYQLLELRTIWEQFDVVG